jgi:hypothetical protein
VIEILTQGRINERDAVREAVLGLSAARRVEHAQATLGAPNTLAADNTGTRAVAAFIEANPELLVGVAALSQEVWDALLEAFILARVDVPRLRGVWARPLAWQKEEYKPSGARSTCAQAVGALARRGWVSLDRAGWPRRAAAVTATGGYDEEDVSHHRPIYPFELMGFVRRFCWATASEWERCVTAAAVAACLASLRTSQTDGLWGVTSAAEAAEDVVRSTIWVAAADSVGVRHMAVSKDKRRRLTDRPRLTGRTMFYRHWAIAKVLAPWIRFRRAGIRRDASVRLFVVADAGLTTRGLTAALDMILPDRDGRTWHGWREGTGRELPLLARSRVTRRRLQLRSVKDLLASEHSYVAAYKAELEGVVAQLGTYHIAASGDELIDVVGRSASAGRCDDLILDPETIRAVTPIW